jgi:hypothetical protein
MHAQSPLHGHIVTFSHTGENVRRQLPVTNNIAPRHKLSHRLPLLARRGLLVLNHNTAARGCSGRAVRPKPLRHSESRD